MERRASAELVEGQKHLARPRRSPSMHEDVEIWCDCCSCEAEPRWQRVEEELDAARRSNPAGAAPDDIR